MGAREHAQELLGVALAARAEARTMTMKQRAELLRVNEPTDRRGTFDQELREAMGAASASRQATGDGVVAASGSGSATAASAPAPAPAMASEVNAAPPKPPTSTLIPIPADAPHVAPSATPSSSRPRPMSRDEIWDLIPPYGASKASGPNVETKPAARAAAGATMPSAQARKASSMFGKTLKTPARTTAEARPDVAVPMETESEAESGHAQMAVAGYESPSLVRRKKDSDFLGVSKGKGKGKAGTAAAASAASGADCVGAGAGMAPAEVSSSANHGFDNVRAEIELEVGNGLGMGFRAVAGAGASAGAVSVLPQESSVGDGATAIGRDVGQEVVQGSALARVEDPTAAASSAQKASSLTSPSVPALDSGSGLVKNADGVVQVKKSKVKGKKEKTAVGTGTATATSPKPKKAKQSAAAATAASPTRSELPEFDYSLQPDILAGQGQTAGLEGEAGGEDARKAKKKAKRAKRDAPPTSESSVRFHRGEEMEVGGWRT